MKLLREREERDHTEQDRIRELEIIILEKETQVQETKIRARHEIAELNEKLEETTR